jgi:phosphoglycerol transferase MdoB-like AlkP superfamily enzyme
MTSGSSKRAALLESIAHYLTAFVVLLKGIDKLNVPGKGPFAITLILIALFIFFGTAFHHRFEKAFRHLKGYVALLESIVMSMIGYLYLKDGKMMLQYVCFGASLLFLVAAIVYFSKVRSHHS